MSYFPIILIPEEIQQVKSAEPPAPTSPNKPIKRAEPIKLDTNLIAIETAIAAIASPIISYITSIPGWLLFFVAVGLITLQVVEEIKTYPQRVEQYREYLIEFSEKMNNYYKEIHRIEEQIKISRTPEQLTKFRYNLLLQILRKTIPYDGDDSIATKNPEEIKFENHLKKYFPGNIYTGLTLKIPNYEYPYTPDFAYIDQELNLYIDIELDEPYVYHTSKPTHYIGYTKDYRRNNFFTRKGWIVIRFSEEQVVSYPQSCCKTVAQVVAQITENTSILNQFINISDLKEQQQWTEQEALEMAENRTRDNYGGKRDILNNRVKAAIMQSIIPISEHAKTNRINKSGITIPPQSETKKQHPQTLLSNTTKSDQSSLANCPYCGVKIKPTKLKSHKESKCPKRRNS